MVNGYENLFNAIWINGITTDIDDAARTLYDYAFSSVYESYCLNTTRPLDRKDKKFKDLKTAISCYSREISQKLLPRVRELAYIESKEWPKNNYVHNDPEYNMILKQLKKDILIFAQNEMDKFIKMNK